jgi:hypothetical protein
LQQVQVHLHFAASPPQVQVHPGGQELQDLQHWQLQWVVADITTSSIYRILLFCM